MDMALIVLSALSYSYHLFAFFFGIHGKENAL